MSSIIALKALNQYRKRDVYAYLGLRYYLDNASANNDAWIRTVCSKLVIEGTDQGYLKTYHYKDTDENGYIHRDVYLPTPNETLSEALLINELSKYKSFHPKPYVFSYRFAQENDSSGLFLPYFNGIKERHDFIAKLCWENEDNFVLYTDIKKFYPSIKYDDAKRVWVEKCLKSDIDTKYVSLGSKLLESHLEVNKKNNTGNGVLTGPMFSHVIANLLLDDIDTKMFDLTNGRYCRYVDDVILVGSYDEIQQWRSELEGQFSNLGLDLHDGDKDFSVPNQQWLAGEKDFNSSISTSWMKLIADIKRFLFANPKERDALAGALNSQSIRIPVLDYSIVMSESSALEKLSDWVRKYKWSKRAIRKITIESIISQADLCKREMLEQLEEYISFMKGADEYEKKRYVPKIRFLSGRLIILLDSDELLLLSQKLAEMKEFHQLVVTINCLVTRDVTECLKMGANATQAAAQLLSVSSLPVHININDFKDVSKDVIEQSLAVLDLNSIKYEIDLEPKELRRLSKGIDIESLMYSQDRYVKEVASLHGIGDVRHSDILSSCFDRNEELALDILNQVQSSKSG
ncbi:RNA-directed DNA polymerase [Vibrio fluvialis]|nr:RNA-directed DNA polymerase [Vibrio fluvialis]MBY8155674.1 RNA-directed DNA polymerase [Vibrio fluvialis]